MNAGRAAHHSSQSSQRKLGVQLLAVSIGDVGGFFPAPWQVLSLTVVLDNLWPGQLRGYRNNSKHMFVAGVVLV